MNSLKSTLDALRDHLSEKHKFTEMPACDLITAARFNTTTIYPVQLFLEWARRVPEVVEFLEGAGFSWDGKEDLRELDRASKKSFSADLGHGYEAVKILGRAGHLYQVQAVEERPIGGGLTKQHLTMVTLHAFHPDCRDWAAESSKNMPGASDGLEWPDGSPVDPNMPVGG
jgi:hypothetical protein